MHGLDVGRRVEDRGQPPQMLFDLRPLAVGLDQLRPDRAVEDDALVGCDQPLHVRVATLQPVGIQKHGQSPIFRVGAVDCQGSAGLVTVPPLPIYLAS